MMYEIKPIKLQEIKPVRLRVEEAVGGIEGVRAVLRRQLAENYAKVNWLSPQVGSDGLLHPPIKKI